MLIGNSEKFSVNIEITEIINDWAYGYFYLVINGTIVGDANDSSVDIKGCIRWIKDFLDNPKDRYEPDLFNMNKDQLFLRLAASVLACEDPNQFVESFYVDTFSRFHLSHIGMSSFDTVTFLVVKNKNGQERCVWKQNDGEVRDAYLEASEIEQVFSNLIVRVGDVLSVSAK